MSTEPPVATPPQDDALMKELKGGAPGPVPKSNLPVEQHTEFPDGAHPKPKPPVVDPLEASAQPPLPTVEAPEPVTDAPGRLPTQAPPAPDPLEVQPPAPPSAIESADAQHSVQAGGPGFAVTVEGEYYAKAPGTPRGKVLAEYVVTVNLLKLKDGTKTALSIIKKGLLLKAIQKKHPKAIGFRTHRLVSAVPRDPNTPKSTNIRYMDRAQLAAYIADRGAPIVPAEYPDEMGLRETVVDFIENPQGFVEREAKRREERVHVAELMDLNPDLA